MNKCTFHKQKSIAPLPKPLEDFRVFLAFTWRALGLPDPTPVQFDIAHYLQTGPRRKIVCAFRGVGKSWITSAYVLWRLRQTPSRTFLVVSAGRERANHFTQFTLHVLKELPLLRCLIPRRGQRSSASSFDVGPARADHAPSVASRGIGSQLTGSRADEIIADDIEIPANALSQVLHVKLLETVKEFDAIIKPNGLITYLGTPQTENSLYTTLSMRGYALRLWPARFPNLEQAKTCEHLAPSIRQQVLTDAGCVGNSLDPTRFSDNELLEREKSYGRSGFQLQFMLDTRLSDAEKRPLRLNDLMVMETDTHNAPEKVLWNATAPPLELSMWDPSEFGGEILLQPSSCVGDKVPYSGAVLAIDPSGRGNDETAACVVKMLNGYLYLTALFAAQGGYEESTLEALATLAAREGVQVAVVEANFGDGMFLRLLSPHFARHHPIQLIERRHTTQKEARMIDTLEPVLNQHRLILAKSVVIEDLNAPLARRLLHQLRCITRVKGSLIHDDRLDCLAMAVSYWSEHMDTDADRRMETRRLEQLHTEMQATKNPLSLQTSPTMRFTFSGIQTK